MNYLRDWLHAIRQWMNPRPQSVIDVDDPGLRVVVTAFDDAEAASAALSRAREWRSSAPAVLRHHLELPEQQIGAARRLLAEDGWTVRPGGRGNVVALRVQQLDALHCSQAGARMAGLAQRLGGTALGWDALQPGAAEA